ncbi:major facilitator superfamily domain-containing protein [Protomyces lactucae-debilis]|uniref:Major facilitator superfamily domain-containing protein n=1 Tax=Protomyces lactucae-debilis TaxID=2754530 RepID=A0A1Y2FV99_PROLT|nr:major facilitator superfamily domain-containing protein [Protomyces lactucae-debilis]ORY87889.1 major facilitator superfamily domain-containing protein [Protomyces lactucae-debilis]
MVAETPSVTSEHLTETGEKDAPVTRVETSHVNGVDESLIVYPSGLKLTGICFGLGCSVFLVALDQTIIATAIPQITNQFKALQDIGWYISAYFLTSAALTATWGRIYRTFNIKFFFLTAIGVFELGSLICGLAPNSITLIIGRAIAGLGVSGIFSGALVIIAYSAPLEKRPALMGMFGAAFGISSIVAPLLGGAFTESSVTWRMCFYINLPIGAITVVTVFFLVKIPTTKSTLTVRQRLRELDLPGAAVLLPAIICLVLALQWGGVKYSWSSGTIIGLFVTAAVLFVIFGGIQWKQGDAATLPPRVIKIRSIWASCLFAALFGGSFFSIVYYIPLYFQAIKGASAVQSGIRILPIMLAVVVSSIVSGGLISKVGYYLPFLIGSAALQAIGVGLITTWQVDSPSKIWIAYQVLAGLGCGAAFQIPLIAVQTVLPLVDIPTGSALISFSQTLGGSVFVAVTQALFQETLAKQLAERVDIPGVPSQFIISQGATGFRKIVDPLYWPEIFEGYMHALRAAYRVALVLSCVAFMFACLVEWRSVKKDSKDKEQKEIALAV